MLVRIVNREDPDQTASERSSLIFVCTVCLGLFGRQLVLEIYADKAKQATYICCNV